MTSRRRPLGLVLAVLAALALIRGAALVMGPLPASGAGSVPGAGSAPVAAGPLLPTTPAAPRPAPLAEATAASLLLGGEDGLLRVDLDARRVRPVALPGGAAGADGGLVPAGGVVVAVRGGAAYAAPGRPGAAAIRLGPASYAFRAATPGRVWLVEQTGDPARWFRVREVALAPPAPWRTGAAGSGPGSPAPGPGWSGPGEGPGPPAPASSWRVLATGTLPLGRRPVAGIPGGVLVQVVGPGGGLAVWHPRGGTAGRRLATGAPVVVAASGATVAWVEGSALHLGDLTTGRDRVVAPPPGSEGFAPAGAFSPDGRVLAAVTRVGFSTRPALALVRVDRATAVRVAGSEGALSDRCSPCLAWSPAGDWVFFNRIGPRLGIGAYRLDRPRAATVALEIPGSTPPSFASI